MKKELREVPAMAVLLRLHPENHVMIFPSFSPIALLSAWGCVSLLSRLFDWAYVPFVHILR